MKIKNTLLSIISLIILLFAVQNSKAQNKKQNLTSSTNAKIEVIQFHSEYRCVTCRKIEALTRETLKTYPDIPFLLINVDEKKNEKMADQFEAAGTALFLYNPETGLKKELTDFAFMNVGNKEKFIEGLKKEIDIFQNQ